VTETSDYYARYYAREREEILDRALTCALPDAVFEIVHYNDHRHQMGPGPYCDPIPLDILHSKGTDEEIAEWTDKAWRLRHAAYWVGDARLRNDGSYDTAYERFRAANPGFSKATYDRAEGYGIWMAR
jgi:hypothetical protein